MFSIKVLFDVTLFIVELFCSIWHMMHFLSEPIPTSMVDSPVKSCIESIPRPLMTMQSFHRCVFMPKPGQTSFTMTAVSRHVIPPWRRGLVFHIHEVPVLWEAGFGADHAFYDCWKSFRSQFIGLHKPDINLHKTRIYIYSLFQYSSCYKSGFTAMFLLFRPREGRRLCTGLCHL